MNQQQNSEHSNYSTQKQQNQTSYLKTHLPHSRPNTAMLTKKLKYLNKLGEDDENVSKP